MLITVLGGWRSRKVFVVGVRVGVQTRPRNILHDSYAN